MRKPRDAPPSCASLALLHLAHAKSSLANGDVAQAKAWAYSASLHARTAIGTCSGTQELLTEIIDFQRGVE